MAGLSGSQHRTSRWRRQLGCARPDPVRPEAAVPQVDQHGPVMFPQRLGDRVDDLRQLYHADMILLGHERTGQSSVACAPQTLGMSWMRARTKLPFLAEVQERHGAFNDGQRTEEDETPTKLIAGSSLTSALPISRNTPRPSASISCRRLHASTSAGSPPSSAAVFSPWAVCWSRMW